MIYDAVLEPELWNHVLEKSSAFVGGMGASIFRQDVIRKVGNVYYTWGMDPDYEKLYFRKYIHINPLLPALLTVDVGRVSSNSEQLVAAEFFETRFYKEWAKPLSHQAFSDWMTRFPPRFLLTRQRHAIEGMPIRIIRHEAVPPPASAATRRH